jgi:acyl-coenzyme A thioesterase PaaI-like protein
MQQNTHLKIDNRLCGDVVKIEKDLAEVHLVTIPEMAADQEGLVHGGFIFGAADFAAMCAVNEPNVVLGSSECRFLAPSRVGDVIKFEARILEREGTKASVEVIGTSGDRPVFTARFKTVVTKEHVLKKQ